MKMKKTMRDTIEILAMSTIACGVSFLAMWFFEIGNWLFGSILTIVTLMISATIVGGMIISLIENSKHEVGATRRQNQK